MKKRNLPVLAFLLFSGFAFAQTVDQYPGLVEALKDAAVEQEDGLRLALYDSLVQRFGLIEAAATEITPPAALSPSKWISSQKIDPLTDKKRYFFALPADSGENDYGKKPTLFVRSDGGEEELFIVWDTYLGNDTDDYKYDSKYVTIRIDSDPPATKLWGNSTDDKASFCPWNDVHDMIRRIGEGSKLVARCTPYGDSPITAVFDIRGLKAVSMPYNEVLGWWE